MEINIKAFGIKSAQKNLDRALKNLKIKGNKATIKAGLHLQRESQIRTPVWTGNLKASAMTVWGSGSVENMAGIKSTDTDPKVATKTQTSTQQYKSACKNNIMSDRLKHTISVFVGFGAYYSLMRHEGVTGTNREKDFFMFKAVQETLSQIIKIIESEIKK